MRGDANRIQEAGVLDIIGRLASPGIWDDQICMLFLIDIKNVMCYHFIKA